MCVLFSIKKFKHFCLPIYGKKVINLWIKRAKFNLVKLTTKCWHELFEFPESATPFFPPVMIYIYIYLLHVYRASPRLILPAIQFSPCITNSSRGTSHHEAFIFHSTLSLKLSANIREQKSSKDLVEKKKKKKHRENLTLHDVSAIFPTAQN